MAEERYLRTADTDEEWRELLRSDDPNIVRSREDWDALIADDERRRSVLPNCEEEIVRAFTEGLEFRGGGLAHADYSMLENCMTVADFFTLWNNFGMSRKLAGQDHFDHKCDGMHNCEWKPGTICTANC